MLGSRPAALLYHSKRRSLLSVLSRASGLSCSCPLDLSFTPVHPRLQPTLSNPRYETLDFKHTPSTHLFATSLETSGLTKVSAVGPSFRPPSQNSPRFACPNPVGYLCLPSLHQGQSTQSAGRPSPCCRCPVRRIFAIRPCVHAIIPTCELA